MTRKNLSPRINLIKKLIEEKKMHNYVGYTIPLSDDQVFTLLEFGKIEWVSPITQLYKQDFILHSYCNGDIQYEYMICDTITTTTVFMYTEDQLKGTKACPSGHFKEQDDMVVYHLSEYETYSLQTQGEVKLWDQYDDTDIVRIGDYVRINLGGNFKYIHWVNDILTYFYETDRSDIDCPY